MSNNSSIGVAFLGFGRMGETHLRNLSGLPRVKVVVVADPRREAAERGKAMSGAEEAMTDIEKAIAHPRVDAVVIVTPTDTHARLLELAAHAGKAVFSEKPIALDLAETTRVVKVIQERTIPVQLGFMRRFDPGYARAKQKIEAGELGRIELFRALSRDTYPPSLEFLLGSGGIFLDMAVHDLDLARFLVGEVEEVQAWGTTSEPRSPVLLEKSWSKLHKKHRSSLPVILDPVSIISKIFRIVLKRPIVWSYSPFYGAAGRETPFARTPGRSGNSPSGIGGSQKLARKSSDQTSGNTSMNQLCPRASRSISRGKTITDAWRQRCNFLGFDPGGGVPKDFNCLV